MSVQINLDQHKIFHPGDNVKGSVIFRPGERADVDYITVEFEALCETKESRSRGQNGSITYSATVRLFHYTIKLFQGPYTLANATREFPFEFGIPTDCREAQPLARTLHGWGSTLELETSFNPANKQKYLNFNRNQPLPPSLTAYKDSLTSGMSSSIKYQVIGKVGTSSAFKGTLENVIQLELQPYQQSTDDIPSIPPHVWSLDVLVKSFCLDPDFEDRALTLREKLKTHFSKNVPETSFKFVVKLPHTMVSDQRVPVFVHVSRQPQDKDTKGIPEVILTKFSLILVTTTHQLVHGGVGLFSNKDYVGSFGQDQVLDTWIGRVPISGDLDLRELNNSGMPPTISKPIPPSFNTFIIGREYQIKLEGEIECAREKKKFVSAIYPIQILARDNLHSSKCQTMGTGILEIGHTEEVLPSYKDATNDNCEGRALS